MTKIEKKEIVLYLIDGFKTTNDPTQLKSLEKKIIKEISECPFSDGIREVFESALLMCTYDVDLYIDKTTNGDYVLDGNEKAITSFEGIYNFIDVSLLE